MPESKRYDFHPEAWAEFEAAGEWYQEQSPETGIRFLASVYEALEDISKRPRTWPKYLHGVRKYTLRQFPYRIVYRETESRIEIIAVSHAHRRPGYWRGRT